MDTHKSRWFCFSSACRPFGMVSLSPDTRTGNDWMHIYIYGTNTIRCFSPPQNALPGGIRDHAGYEHSHDAYGGGTLEIDSRPEPNRNWGVAK